MEDHRFAAPVHRDLSIQIDATLNVSVGGFRRGGQPPGRRGGPDRRPIAGDDEAAKAAVTSFLDSLGYDAVDVGPLAESWRFQRDTTGYAGLHATDGDWERPATVDAQRLRGALAAARRYADG